jgi:hypothetical protein
MCGGIGLKQMCKEHRAFHGHGMIHLQKKYKGMHAWWLCNACAEKEQ